MYRYYINFNNFRFGGDFQNCLCQICGYKRLKREVEMMRKTPYSQENPEHEEKLMKVYLPSNHTVKYLVNVINCFVF